MTGRAEAVRAPSTEGRGRSGGKKGKKRPLTEERSDYIRDDAWRPLGRDPGGGARIVPVQERKGDEFKLLLKDRKKDVRKKSMMSQLPKEDVDEEKRTYPGPFEGKKNSGKEEG